MDLPLNLPKPLYDVLTLSDRLDGASVIFTPEDRVAFVNPALRRYYPFDILPLFSFEDIILASVRSGLYGPNELCMPPADYIAMAKAARRANEKLDFVKRYAHGNMIGHHRAVDGWSVQVRLPMDSPLWRGGFGGLVPNSLAEAAGAADATRNMRRAIDSIATGMIFIHREHGVQWSNTAGRHCIDSLRGVEIVNCRIVFEDRETGREFANAVEGVLKSPLGARKFMTLPKTKGGRAICSIVHYNPDEVILLTAPRLDGDSVIAALRGFGLTAAETQVALLTAEGYKPQEVADIIGKSANTVRAQLASIFKKTGEDAPPSRAGIAYLISGVAAVAGP